MRVGMDPGGSTSWLLPSIHQLRDGVAGSEPPVRSASSVIFKRVGFDLAMHRFGVQAPIPPDYVKEVDDETFELLLRMSSSLSASTSLPDALGPISYATARKWRRRKAGPGARPHGHGAHAGPPHGMHGAQDQHQPQQQQATQQPAVHAPLPVRPGHQHASASPPPRPPSAASQHPHKPAPAAVAAGSAAHGHNTQVALPDAGYAWHVLPAGLAAGGDAQHADRATAAGTAAMDDDLDTDMLDPGLDIDAMLAIQPPTAAVPAPAAIMAAPAAFITLPAAPAQIPAVVAAVAATASEQPSHSGRGRGRGVGKRPPKNDTEFLRRQMSKLRAKSARASSRAASQAQKGAAAASGEPVPGRGRGRGRARGRGKKAQGVAGDEDLVGPAGNGDDDEDQKGDQEGGREEDLVRLGLTSGSESDESESDLDESGAQAAGMETGQEDGNGDGKRGQLQQARHGAAQGQVGGVQAQERARQAGDSGTSDGSSDEAEAQAEGPQGVVAMQLPVQGQMQSQLAQGHELVSATVPALPLDQGPTRGASAATAARVAPQPQGQVAQSQTATGLMVPGGSQSQAAGLPQAAASAQHQRAGAQQLMRAPQPRSPVKSRSVFDFQVKVPGGSGMFNRPQVSMGRCAMGSWCTFCVPCLACDCVYHLCAAGCDVFVIPSCATSLLRWLPFAHCGAMMCPAMHAPLFVPLPLCCRRRLCWRPKTRAYAHSRSEPCKQRGSDWGYPHPTSLHQASQPLKLPRALSPTGQSATSPSHPRPRPGCCQ